VRVGSALQRLQRHQHVPAERAAAEAPRASHVVARARPIAKTRRRGIPANSERTRRRPRQRERGSQLPRRACSGFHGNLNPTPRTGSVRGSVPRGKRPLEHRPTRALSLGADSRAGAHGATPIRRQRPIGIIPGARPPSHPGGLPALAPGSMPAWSVPLRTGSAGVASPRAHAPGPCPRPRADWRACSRAATPF
jgi:hypothetical protein